MRRLTFWLVLAGVAVASAAAVVKLSEPGDLYLRAFKREGELEVWGRHGGTYRLLKTYAITAASGLPGPKRREGDLQVPEGFYEVDRFNPQSRFHLSLGLNYPNAADRILADPEHPGFDIYIHGGAVSIGCLPLGDEAIEEVYHLAEKIAGQGRKIPVHLFPARMAGAEWEKLRAGYPELQAFWAELQPGYEWFEKRRQVPRFSVTREGHYVIAKP